MHVRTSPALHRCFHRLQPAPPKFAQLSGPIRNAPISTIKSIPPHPRSNHPFSTAWSFRTSLVKNINCLPPPLRKRGGAIIPNHFHCTVIVLSTIRFASLIDSLARVSRWERRNTPQAAAASLPPQPPMNCRGRPLVQRTTPLNYRPVRHHNGLPAHYIISYDNKSPGPSAGIKMR